jgi:hypothetical protein
MQVPASNPWSAPANARRVHVWIRDAHLYAGLLVGPFVIIYALSAILFNHAWLPWGGPTHSEPLTRTAQFTPLPDEDEALRLGQALVRQLEVVGEIGFVRRHPNPPRIQILVEKPGRRIRVDASLTTNVAIIEEKATGVWDALLYLHARPGMHLTAIRGNWFPMKIWGWVADATAYLVLFLTVSGVYLWTVLKAERKAGLLWLGTGAVSFLLLVWIVVS